MATLDIERRIRPRLTQREFAVVLLGLTSSITTAEDKALAKVLHRQLWDQFIEATQEEREFWKSPTRNGNQTHG